MTVVFEPEIDELGEEAGADDRRSRLLEHAFRRRRDERRGRRARAVARDDDAGRAVAGDPVEGHRGDHVERQVLHEVLGAEPADLVPFDKYAAAAEGLGKPSSAARALFGGAANIERVDCLVRRIAGMKGHQLNTLEEIVTLVDDRLGKNRAAAVKA